MTETRKKFQGHSRASLQSKFYQMQVWKSATSVMTTEMQAIILLLAWLKVIKTIGFQRNLTFKTYTRNSQDPLYNQTDKRSFNQYIIKQCASI